MTKNNLSVDHVDTENRCGRVRSRSSVYDGGVWFVRTQQMLRTRATFPPDMFEGHLEHSMERIGSDTRAYHSLASRGVWDQPNMSLYTLLVITQ